MLRKKLKLDTESCTTSPACAVMDEFALSQFANNPKQKLKHTTTVPVPCVGPIINMPSMKESYEKEQSGIPYWRQVYRIELDLSAGLRKIVLPSNVAACYDPIDYAAEIHSAYLERFLDGPKPVLFVGMNPGPWGMCQTGVPFGYVPAVRDWMGLRGTVSKPTPELPARPVEGLSCTREEQSGKRWWGLFQELCGTPEAFFRSCFVYNLCPLAFFHDSGRNITPSELKGKAKGEIQTISEQYLSIALTVLKPQIIISVGRYTEDRVKSLIKQQKLNPSIVTHCMPHPSPRSLNNTNWNEKAKVWLTDHGIMPYLTA
ncbi:single-strand selective monofunctional uracil DNA glycosylase [Anopheles ziemanni]|uniref:single-strand selective monofunctional uracil DNA glycosylase n=1 Tax=Anopheles coustani TaxID=139045 RepID=UPI002659DA1A|nr:single-strand selective monofunctional uracil DNA glycosylase [Anopheles coustani]XP_058171813.1 single-strand selective monofunctional uracil DNA glycosylase [Anopheles ziemanni]